MVTASDNIFKLNRQETGFLSWEHVAPRPREKYAIHIPRLMPMVPRGAPIPRTYPVCSRGPSVFINGIGCAAVLPMRNHFEIPMEQSKWWNEKQLVLSKEERNGVTGRIDKSYVKDGLKVVCNCKSDMTQEMTFSNDIIDD